MVYSEQNETAYVAYFWFDNDISMATELIYIENK
jgi:hypothetical protein